jgi:hypothetical protein
MGDPAEVSPRDRLAVRTLASAIVDSVRADEEMPLGLDEVTTGGRAYYRRSDVETLAFGLAQEIGQLAAERDRRTAAIWAVVDAFDGAVRNFETRGQGGQHVPYHGDFASMPPSTASQMRRWIRDLMEALHDRWPMNRTEFSAAYPSVDTKALDEMFKERTP